MAAIVPRSARSTSRSVSDCQAQIPDSPYTADSIHPPYRTSDEALPAEPTALAPSPNPCHKPAMKAPLRAHLLLLVVALVIPLTGLLGMGAWRDA